MQETQPARKLASCSQTLPNHIIDHFVDFVFDAYFYSHFLAEPPFRLDGSLVWQVNILVGDYATYAPLGDSLCQ